MKIVDAWACQAGLDGVVWTALKPRFNKKDGCMPTIDQVLGYLRGLSHNDHATWNLAQEYVRKAPRQIDTDYRRRMECEFGWTPLSEVKPVPFSGRRG
jgi:hypothetical protein